MSLELLFSLSAAAETNLNTPVSRTMPTVGGPNLNEEAAAAMTRHFHAATADPACGTTTSGRPTSCGSTRFKSTIGAARYETDKDKVHVEIRKSQCWGNCTCQGCTVFPAYSDTLGKREKRHYKQVSL